MNAAQKKTVQYLAEAHAAEQAGARVLQAQIAMTPEGTYRSAIEKHLEETNRHVERTARRLAELDQGSNPIMVVIGAAETVVGQAIALGKTPLDLLRGSGGEEKVLKNAKDSCATEAMEVATYTALERLAKAVGDDETAKLAASILAEEERMLQRALREIPKLTDAVFRADVKDDPSYDITTTGAADTVRKAGAKAETATRRGATKAKRTSRQARKVPGVARAEGQVKGAVADAGDLAIARYDKLTADEVTAKLPELSQIDLAKVDAYERKTQDRTTVLNRISTLRGDEPWAGYDELNASEVQTALTKGDDDLAKKVRSYERAHKGRAGVLKSAERERTTA